MSAASRGYLFAAVAVALWSGFILVSRLGGISRMTAFDITAVRFATAAVLLLPVWLARAGAPIFNRRTAALALTGGVGYALLAYSGFKLSSAVHAAVLLPGLMPFGIAIVARLVLGERPSSSRLIGLVVIGAGVAFLALDAFRTGTGSWVGDLLIVASSLLWAVYTVLLRRWSINPWDAAIGVTALSALVYLPIYVSFLPKAILVTPWSDIALQAFYQGALAPIVAAVVYIRATALLGPTRIGTLMALVPAISGIAAAFLLGEALSPWLIAGLAAASTGAWVGTLDSLPVGARRPCPA
jgi:drug/metabolite transporter (DMT)-like permease